MRKLFILLLVVKLLFAFGFVDESQKIVPVEKAYTLHAALKGDKIAVSLKMADGVYVYKNEIKLYLNDELIKPKLPQPQKLHGDEVYTKELNITIPVPKDAQNIDLRISYQGCNKVGICYPPQTKEFKFEHKIKEKGSVKKSQTSKKLSEEESIASTLRHSSLGVILLTFFGFGLLLALTPCVFPMIPILSSLIVGAKDMNTKKAFIYSIVYVLAMSVAYTIAGVLAGLFGANLQAALQNPVAITIFALIFVALALSMFGFYEISLPASWQTKLTKKSDEAGSKGGLIGVAIMGFLSALIVGPCVAPPLAGALVYIGQTGDALLGGLALFVMSLGMGMPLILVGTGAGKFMPKPGGWMEAVSRVFGVVMLGVAIWMLERILPPAVTMLLWATLFISSAIYLRALEPLPSDARGWGYLKKSIGIILFIYGVIVMVGALSGATTIFKPLSSFQQRSGVVDQKGALFKEVKDLKEFQEILQSSQKPVMLDITAKWCTSCKELEEITFADSQVRKMMQNFEAVKLDVTDNSQSDKEFLKSFGLYGPPAILFFKRDKELKKYRVVGYKNPQEFMRILKSVLKE